MYELAKRYHLDLSLFERLINNKVDFACLGFQHRMRPSISRLLKLIYPELEDHEVVSNYPNVQGLAQACPLTPFLACYYLLDYVF